ncbi:L1 [Canis familiaris papillomavirus 7]|uniref:Major capsid protein L1 n=1 Tax=Canis familiaris papillomavirus 7 TaxID=2759772 RepID=C8YJK4_9PAPI|nr:L1 [Canis familiaris papillomavirus 7]
MAFWMKAQGRVYLPPPKPVGKVLHTDEFVRPTSIFYYGSTERLLTVGNPYFEVKNVDQVVVPKVSGNQYRAFRLIFPDPNKFAINDTNIFDPENERLVWSLQGLEIGRGGPLGFGTTGNILMDKLQDTENPNKYTSSSKDDRQNMSLDPKQTQLFVVGCTPCKGEHWDVAPRCKDQEPQYNQGDCPPLQLVSSIIEDGQMCDVGFGAMNFAALQFYKAGVPMDIVNTTCKWPDFLQMTNEKYGNSCFFFGKREQVYCRHMFVKSGSSNEKLPPELVIKGDGGRSADTANYVYYGTPSGSLLTSDSQLFNRPYWIKQAQGQNNGIIWNNNLFITVVDNTRNTNFNINQSINEKAESFDNNNMRNYTRHVEEYELTVILQLCKVSLDPDVLAHLHTMDPSIIDNWNLGYVPPPTAALESNYRFIESQATMCPAEEPPKKKEDPYDKYTFWTIDMTEKLSLDLDQYSLGRRFLYQYGLKRSTSSIRSSTKRTAAIKNTSVAKKRRKK